MISKTSLFNKGIYKSTLRRYLWGSTLYFVMLFIVTGMMIMLNEDPSKANYYWSMSGESTLLETSYMIFPMLMCIVVPTIAGLLIFRYIHSKKAAVFTHSLPVKRSANFISSTLAALTLMAAPIILNTIILMIMSLTAYSLHFTVGDCITWMLLNLFGIFVMFSSVCFVSVITGNSFAMVGLNILFHTIGLILAASFSSVCNLFLHGFAGEASLIDTVFNNAFITRVPTIITNWEYANEITRGSYINDIITYSIVALVIYVISGFLYGKRKMETAEDVAGFKCLNYIFKYLVTFIASIITFAIFCGSIYDSPITLFATIAVVSVVIYFGAEMILKKTLKVWSSYKGYLGFAAAFAVMLCIFAFTSFFGFETHVPKEENIESVAIYEYYNREIPNLSNDEIIKTAIDVHKESLSGREILAKLDYRTTIRIEYTLKNGRVVERVYPIEEEKLYEIMNRLYECDDYKEKLERIFTPMDKVYNVRISSMGERDATETDEEKIAELIECIKKDIYNLNYSRIYSDGWGFGFEFEYSSASEDEYEDIVYHNDEARTRYVYVRVNPNYENTMRWVKENGYWEYVSEEPYKKIYIARAEENLPFIDENGELRNNEEDNSVLKFESEADCRKIIEFMHSYPSEHIPETERFNVYLAYDDYEGNVNLVASISREQIGELFPDSDWQNLK